MTRKLAKPPLRCERRLHTAALSQLGFAAGPPSRSYRDHAASPVFGTRPRRWLLQHAIMVYDALFASLGFIV